MTAGIVLSEAARSDLAWLRQRLGPRVRGPFLDPSGDFAVILVRRYFPPGSAFPQERREHWLGSSPEQAISRARASVEEAITKARE